MAISRALEAKISSRTTRPFSRSVVPVCGEVDDPLDEPGQRRELDRALDLDDLDLAAGARRSSAAAIFGYLVAMRITPSRRSASAVGSAPACGGEDHRAVAPKPRSSSSYDLALGLLAQDVLAGDADVRGARLHVGRDVATAAS